MHIAQFTSSYLYSMKKAGERMGKYARGIQAEDDMLVRIQSMLKRYSDLDFKIVKDVCYMSASKKIAQIDAILICNKGLFCIEFKSWHGIVKASLERTWIVDTGNFDVRYNNPVLQNSMHRAAIDALVHHKLPNLKNYFKSVVVFDERANLINEIYDSIQRRNIQLYSNVIHVEDFMSFFIEKIDRDEISSELQDKIYNILLDLKERYKPLFDKQQQGIIHSWEGESWNGR